MTTRSPATLLWSLVLAAGAIGGTLATACMMPFVAVAVLAAATMRRDQALVTVTGAWAANQLLGFGLLGYPLDVHAIGWGAALGGASVAAVPVARAVLARTAPSLAGVVAAFVAAFAAFEALLFALAVATGGLATFAPAIVLAIGANDAGWGAAFGVAYLVLTRAAPRWFGAPPPLRLA